MQHRSALRAGQAGGDVDDPAAQGGILVLGVLPPASTPAARSRLCAIAAHRIQAELAPKRPDVIFSSVVARPVDLLGYVVVSVADVVVNRVR